MLPKANSLIPAWVLGSVFVLSCAGVQAAEPTSTPRRVPPYGVIQFGFGHMSNQDDWDFMRRCHVNLCEGAVYTPVSECWGWRGREWFDKRVKSARAQVKAAHDAGIQVVSYVAYHPFYGDADKRTGLFDFYDKRWDEYKDYLGPRPPDPIEWTKRDSAGKPMPFTYATSRGYYICPNNPHWLRYLDGVLHMFADCGVDGIRYDGPIGPCWCEYCQRAFRKWLQKTYTPKELAEHFGVKDIAAVRAPTKRSDPLQVPWKRYGMFRQGETVAETGAAVRRHNPNFIMSYNYCIWGGHVAGSSRNEYLAAASDYALIEGNFNATAHSENGRKHSASADCKYLLASGDGKPVDMHYYMYPCARTRAREIARWPRAEVEGNAVFWRAAIAEGMAGGCPYPIMCGRAHPNARQAVIDYCDFFYRARPYLADAKTYANVTILASISQTCASQPTYPLSVSRFLADRHIPHTMIVERDLTPKRLAQYDVLLLPEARVLSAAQAKVIAEFVTGGKGLVVFGPAGSRSRFKKPLPASSLGRVLGIERGAFPKQPFRRTAGRGRVAWFPSARLPIPGRWPTPKQGIKDLAGLPQALKWAAGGEFSAYLNAPDMVELNLMESPNRGVLLIHLMNYNVTTPAKITSYDNLRLEVALPQKGDVDKTLLLSPDLPVERTALETKLLERNGRRFLAAIVPHIEVYDLVAIVLKDAKLAPMPADAAPAVTVNVAGPSRATPGQQVVLKVAIANRSQARLEHARLTLALPKGWSAPKVTAALLGDIQPGRRKSVSFAAIAPENTKLDTRADFKVAAEMTLDGREAATLTTRHRVLVIAPMEMRLDVIEQINPVTRTVRLAARMANVGSREIEGKLALELPQGWQAETQGEPFDLGGGESKLVPLAATVPADIKPGAYEVAAHAAYQAAGKPYSAKAACKLEMKGTLLAVQCPRTDTPPKLDGKLDDACWRAAAKLDGFQRHDGSGPATDQTEGFVVRDGKNLYIAMRCSESLVAELAAACKVDAGKVWLDDSVEVYFDVGHTHKAFQQLVANCIGAKYSYPGGFEWHVATGREPAAWTIEMRIPFASLKRSPERGEIWGFNLCRTRPAKGLAQTEYSCWSCTYGGFAKVQSFGHLAF